MPVAGVVEVSAPERARRSQRFRLQLDTELAVIGTDGAGRGEIERYIATKFECRYGATLSQFMPEILALRCAGAISAAVGFRKAAQSELFLERYLDSPAEQKLSEMLGRPVSRYDISEIGNLVSTWSGSSQLLFIAITEVMFRRGTDWTIFTATPEVSKLLSRLGLDQVTLCPADGQRLGDELTHWGSYYDTCPQVIAVNARDARALLVQRRSTAELLVFCQQQLSEHGDACVWA